MNVRSFSVIVTLCVASFAHSEPFIEHIDPPVAERGATRRVTFVGTDLAGTQDVWHSLEAGDIRAKKIEASSTRAVFDLTLSKEAAIGICGLRLATRDGLSNAHLFLIDDLPVRSASAKVQVSCTIAGTFKEATVDRYTVTLPKGRMSFEIVGSRFGKDADPLITIRDAKGRMVVERDNDPGLYFDSRFEHDFAEAGEYTIEVREARFRGSEHFRYALRIGKFPPERVAVPNAVRSSKAGAHFANVRRSGDDGSNWLPVTSSDADVTIGRSPIAARSKAWAWASSPATTLAFNLSPLRANPFLPVDALLPTGKAQAVSAKVPGILCGVLRTPGERQTFHFELAKGQKIAVRAEAKSLNSPADLDVVLVNKVGRELRRANEAKDEITFDFTAPAAGVYGIAVRDQLRDGGPAFAYRITVVENNLPPNLLADVEGLAVPQGSYQPIPIKVVRNGHAGPITLSLRDAPPGVSLTPSIIGDGENAVVCRIAATSSTPIGIYSPRIVADAGPHKTLVSTQPLIDRKLVNVDLIPLALRDDQTRLPPTLTDRFALQVMPPSPFEMEISEKTITLPRYQKAGIPITISRVPGFDGVVSFRAEGGQLADKNEGRTRVFAEFPDAKPGMAKIDGVIVSKILSNLDKPRIEVSGTTAIDGRRITLTRTFELNLTTAFVVSAETKKLALLPGESAKVKLLLERVKSFDGEVLVELQRPNGVRMPEKVTFAKGQSSVEFDVKAESDAMPNRFNVQGRSAGTVDTFEEEVRSQMFEIEIRKVEAKKK